MPPSWRDPIAEYCEWLALSHASPETVKLRVYQLRRVALELRIPPFELDTERLADWLGSKSWSRSTARSWRSTLTSFYTWAVRAGRCDSSPTERLPKLAPDQGGRKREPASDIAVAWGMRASDPRVRLMVQLGARLGMRVGEISRAAREDVIPDLLGYSLIVHGKGGKRRIVPIPDKLAEQLLAMPPGYFFPGQDNGHLSAAYVSKLVSRAMPVGQTGHMLRHRRASRAYIETGHDIRAVQELLGHASVATTQIYVAVPNEQLRRAVGGDL